ncbi:hypothetical protein PR048_023094 [Dryococelus australis]|uniref:Uncharacterized protein n=1 Tax=Dryococelus australis TaxID=614101 RepID=A0ABQ9GT76_9NEOP|nr:hypothetical protein PR048_023094 [Dryococelus australis]
MILPSRWVGWPTWSPDLNLFYFYMWGHLKCLICRHFNNVSVKTSPFFGYKREFCNGCVNP